MKNKFLKLLSFALVGVTLFSVGACKTTGENSSSINPDSSFDSTGESLENEYSGEKKYVIQNGSANYCIVVPETASLAIKNAAQELNMYVEQSTGVSMKTYNDTDEIPDRYHVLSLGKTQQLANANFSFDYNLNGDGFYMWTKGDDLFIDSNYDRGIMNGVYEFLERFLDIKFISYDYYYVPQKSDVVIYDLEITEIPTFRERDVFCAVETEDWMSKLRYVDPYGYAAESKYGEGYEYEHCAAGHSSVSWWLPKDRYYASHPEWYSDTGNQVNPCSGLDENDNYTGDINSGIYTTIQNIKSAIISNPQQKYFFVGQEDNGEYQCADVTESLKRNGNSMSAVWMIYINTIAKEIDAWVKENYPDREIKIGTFAYQWTMNPPVKEVNGEWIPINEKVVPPDNVYIQWTPMGACWYHAYMDDSCATNQMYAAYLEGWSSICDSFMVWDYQCNYSNYLFWFPHYGAMKKNYEAYQEAGFWRILQQHSTGESDYYQNILDAYIGSKLMWDINLNVDDLIKEFNYYYYEDVHEYVDQFVDLMETHYATLNANNTVCLGMYDNVGSGSCQASLWPITLLEKGLSLIETAMDEVNKSNRTEVEKAEMTKRLVRVIVHPLYMILANFESYYDSELKYDFAQKFVYYAEMINTRRISEGQMFEDYKESLGF